MVYSEKANPTIAAEQIMSEKGSRIPQTRFLIQLITPHHPSHSFSRADEGRVRE
jgi:hypothetical protein